MVKQAVSIKVGCKTYHVSNSWNSLFLCGKEEVRHMTALSVFEQLRAEKYKDAVEVRLISFEPQKYDGDIAGAFDADLIKGYLAQMHRRYDLIAESESKNYILYNRKTDKEKLKLSVLIVDGPETVAESPAHFEFLTNLQILTQKSRAAGIHVIALVNELPIDAEGFFSYYGTPVHVMRKGFFTKDATNTIIKELCALGYDPTLNLSYDRDDETIRIIINAEIRDVRLSFSFNYDAPFVNYALLFPIDDEIDLDTKMEIYRTLRTDGSHCYDGFSDGYYEGHLAITGSRRESGVTPLFLQCMVEEIGSLHVVEKLRALQKPGFIY